MKMRTLMRRNQVLVKIITSTFKKKVGEEQAWATSSRKCLLSKRLRHFLEARTKSWRGLIR
jgi:hypothetical protein